MTVLELPHGDPLAGELHIAVRFGEVAKLQRMVSERPELANARLLGRDSGWKSTLHITADWPGYFPSAPESVRILLAAGADVDADTGGDKPETPLHWAASNDDVDVAQALIDGGADLETPGGSIGTPLDNAVGYGCGHVARLLVASGARIDKLWQAAALGHLRRLEELAAGASAEEISQAFWHACGAAERRAAEYLLGLGASLEYSPEYAWGTPLDAATGVDTRRQNVVTWLKELGVGSAADQA